MHIGILQADSVMEQFQSRFGNYPEMFVRMLEGATELRPEFSTFDARDIEYPRADACDAYIITGSRHSVYDDAPWIRPLADFVGAALAAERKIVGICFGHQLIAHFFGGRTEPAEAGWGVGVHSVEFIGSERWMQPAQSKVGLLSSHKDQVVELPLNARIIARTEFCPNSGYVIGDQVLTLQGHPEFSKSYVDELMRTRQIVLGEQTFLDGVASLQEETHEALVARWIVNFIEGS